MRKLWPNLLYILAAVILILQFSLTFDNVLWGDEAFSANTVRGNSFADILQISHFWDSHPPFYYFWLKVWTDLLGLRGQTLHFASFVCFLILCIFVITIYQRRYGKTAAALVLIFVGLARNCAEYVQEVRMYELAFMFIFLCLYFLQSAIHNNRMKYWIPAVIFGLGAAYSHYYALMLSGLLLFYTMVIVQIRFGKKAFLRGLISIFLFAAGYSPWLPEVLYKFREHTGNWWMTANSPAKECLEILFGSRAFLPVMVGIFTVSVLISLLIESGMIAISNREKKICILSAPTIKGWSTETWTILLGVSAILTEILIVLTASKIVVPMLAKRYLFPSTAVVIFLITIALSAALKNLKQMGNTFWRVGSLLAGMAVLTSLVLGLADYKEYRSEVKTQSFLTKQVLEYIETQGKSGEELVLVNNGVTHIGWTVLQYYFPDSQVINGGYDSTDVKDFWIFCQTPIDQSMIDHMVSEKGYMWDDYGIQQIAKYPCFMYHFFKERQ